MILDPFGAVVDQELAGDPLDSGGREDSDR